MSIQIPSFSVSKNTNNSKVRFYCVSVFSQTPITLFDSDAEAEKFSKEKKFVAYIPTSAKTGQNVDKIFPKVIECSQRQKKSCTLI